MIFSISKHRLFIALFLAMFIVACGSDDEQTAASDETNDNDMVMESETPAMSDDGMQDMDDMNDMNDMADMNDMNDMTDSPMADAMPMMDDKADDMLRLLDQPKARPKSNVPPAVQAAEIARINKFFDETFNAVIARSPEFQSSLGIKDNQDKWDNISDEFQREGIQIDKRSLNQLRTDFNIDLLDEPSKLNYRLLEDVLVDSIADEKYLLYNYPVNQMFGVHASAPSFLINVHQISNRADAEAYIQRIINLPAKFATLETNLKTRAKMGIILPAFLFPKVIDDCMNLLSGYPLEDSDEDHPLFADFVTKLEAVEGLSDDDFDDLVFQLEDALLDHFQGAYESLVSLLNTLSKQATDDAGVWKFTDGDNFYNRALAISTTTQMSADEVHQYGLSEVARIHAEMTALLGDLRYKKDLQSFFNQLRSSKKYYYKNKDSGREQYLDAVKVFADDIKAKLPEFFNTLPQADVVVKRVEAFREKSAGKAFYSRPAPDGSRPGVYYVNLYDMSQMPKYQMEALTYHEGVPGHHMQIAIAQELQEVPNFRKFASYTAYIEGWGLYSENLGKDMGGYQDPLSDFGRLAMELWRACRLVVDTGIHNKKWTREEGVKYYTDNTPNPKEDAQSMVDRHMVLPGQATAYKIGMKVILELRAKAKVALGDKFDIKLFHDTILNNGAVPLKVLEDLVDQYIAEAS